MRIDDLRRLATTEAGHFHERDFDIIKPVFYDDYGFIPGTWDELTPPQRFHNAQLKYRLIDVYGFALLHKVVGVSNFILSFVPYSNYLPCV
jgi:hypothetical protein